MPDKKPTDAEIVKALEGVIQFDNTVDRSVLDMVDVQTLKNALDLINRLKAEIATAKSEAYKEFAERVKALLPNDGMSSKGRFKFGRIKSLDIDNLLKEMG